MNPVIVIETPHLEEALQHVINKGAIVKAGIESRLGITFFTFNDPDGNGIMVCQSK